MRHSFLDRADGDVKLWVFSDLRLDVHSLDEPLTPPDADACVVAGDVLTGGITPSVEWLAENIGRHMPVFFVPGEREFFNSSWNTTLTVASDTRFYRGVHLLDNATATFGDVTFVGTTLWTDFAALGEQYAGLCMEHAAAIKEDYRRIDCRSNPFGRLTPANIRRKHFDCRRFLTRTLRQRRDLRFVVITHHAPSVLSACADRRMVKAVAADASNLDGLVADTAPQLWVHGHLRGRVDYILGQTRIVANPRDFPGYEGIPSFDPSLIVTV